MVMMSPSRNRGDVAADGGDVADGHSVGVAGEVAVGYQADGIAEAEATRGNDRPECTKGVLLCENGKSTLPKSQNTLLNQ